MSLRPFSGGGIECSSRMKESFQVRFLGDRAVAMPLGYPAKRTARRFRLASTSGVRFRYSRQKEPHAGAADAGCYGNSINLSLKSLARRGLGQNDVIDFQHIAVLATICVTLPPAPSVFQEDSSGAGVYTRGSVRRASGFVLTGNPSRATFREEQRESTEPLCINVVSL
jgi:hypothetical protein